MDQSQDTNHGASGPAPRRRTARWALALGAIVLACLASLVALAPTLVSRGLFRSRIVAAVGGSVNGTVTIDEISLGWSGPLAARGVVIDDPAAGNRISADLTLEQGLWTLISKGAERLDLRIGGALRTRREADGSIGISKLLRASDPATPGAPASPDAGKGSGRPGLPAGIRHVSVTIEKLDLEVSQPDGTPYLAVRDLAGSATIDAGTGADVRLAAKTELQGSAGSLELKASMPGIVAADGSLALAAAGADIELRATDVALETGGLAVRVPKANATVKSKQLTGRLDLLLDVSASLGDAAPTTIAAELAVDRALAADGSFVLDLSAIHGQLRVADLPTKPFEAFAAGTGIVLARDVGPKVALEARFADATGGDLAIALRSDAVTLSARGAVDPATRAANFSSIEADAALAPALLDALAQVTVSAPARLSLRARSVSIPAAAADGSVPVDALAFDADAALDLPGLQVPGPEGRVPFDIGALRLTARAAPVSAGVELSATADRAGGGPAVAPAAARPAPAAAPAGQPMQITARVRRGGAYGAHGSLRIERLPAALVRPFVPRSAGIDVALDLGPTIDSVDASVGDGGAPEIALKVVSPNLRADLRAVTADDGSLRVRPGGSLEASPLRRSLLEPLGLDADGDLSVGVAIRRLDLPPIAGGIDPARVAFDLDVGARPFAQPPVAIRLGKGEGARTLRVTEARVVAAADPLGTKARAAVTLRSDLADVDATVDAAGLGDLSAAAIERSALVVRAKVANVASARLAQELPAAKDVLPHLGGAAWTMEVAHDGSLLDGVATVSVRSGTTEIAAKAALRPDEVAVEATAALDATPALVRAAAPGLPAELAAPSRVTATLARTSFKRTATWAFEPPADLRAGLRVPMLEAAKVSGVKGNPVLTDLALDAQLSLGARAAAKGTLSGTLAARRAPAAAARIAPLRSSFEWIAGEGGAPAAWKADVALSPIAAEGLAALIDLDDAARREIGSGASVSARASSVAGGISFELGSTLERLKAQVAGTLVGDDLSLSRSSVDLALSAAQATELANAVGAKPGADGKAPPPAWREVGPVAVRAQVDSLRMRLGGGISSAVVAVEAKPFPMVAADGQRITVDGVSVSVDAPSAERAAIRASTALAGAGGRAPITLDATVAGWSRPDGTFSADALRIDGSLKAEKASTAVLGVLLGTGAELGEAVGPDLTVNATAASSAPGVATLAARATARYLTLEAPRLDLRAGALSVAPAKPVTLDFLPSEPVRRRYLASINPIFRDVRLADERKPIRFAVESVSYPVDGDLSRLDGDMRLTVGAVLLERNPDNEILNLLKAFQGKDSKPIDGTIDPLVVQIRKGQLAYKDFSVGIERQGDGWRTRLIFDGDIDLTKQPAFARTIAANYPMGSLAREVVGLLPNEDGGGTVANVVNTVSLGVGDALQLRIRFRGPLGDVDGKPAKLERKVKVVFDGKQMGKDIGKTVETVGGVIGDLFKKKGK